MFCVLSCNGKEMRWNTDKGSSHGIILHLNKQFAVRGFTANSCWKYQSGTKICARDWETETVERSWQSPCFVSKYLPNEAYIDVMPVDTDRSKYIYI